MKTHATRALPRPGPENSFRHLLQAELGRRCADNPRYSLRAFAMTLETDHSTLSQLMRGKRRATEPTIRRLGRRLGLDNRALAVYVANEARWSRNGDGLRVQQLTADAARAVADWYHFAILELLRLESFRPDSRWIGRMLGIEVDEVNLALHRLIHLGLLEMRSPEEWVDCSGHAVGSFEEFGKTTVQKLHEQVREVPTSHRDHSSTTVAINTQRLGEAIERLARFRQEMIELFEVDTERNDVYRLEINLFPLTRFNTTKEVSDGMSGDEMADRCERP